MVENFIVIQLTFAEIFVPQDFTIKLLLGSVEPQTHVQDKVVIFSLNKVKVPIRQTLASYQEVKT